MAKNTILMIGDGMGWEMARAAAIQAQINAGKTGTKLSDFYTSGTGTGLNMQKLTGYGLATTYGTTVAGDTGVYNSSLSALNGGNTTSVPTDSTTLRTGFSFDPTFNPGTTASGGAKVADGVKGNLVGYDPAKGGATPWTAGTDKEYIKYSYPDSANTATTLYTGVKSYNGAIGVDIYEKSLDSVLAQAAEAGKATGLVTSVPIDHATPAAAAANVNNRNKFDTAFPALDNILQQELRLYQPNVLLGGGHPLSNSPTALPTGVEPVQDNTYIKAQTYAELSAKPNATGANSNIYGYTFLERGKDAAAVLAATAKTIDPDKDGHLLGLYGARGQDGNLPVSSANGDYSTTGLGMFSVNSSKGLAQDFTRPLLPGETDASFIARERNENPTLDDLTKAALEVLGKDKDGMWLMIEGGDIDWAAHDNNIDNLIGTMFDFDKAVGSVIDWIGKNGGWEQNELIITADHDHYLTLNDNFPELLRTKGAEALTAIDTTTDSGQYWGSKPDVIKVTNATTGVVTDDPESGKYGWGSHTNRPVPVYYQGADTSVLSTGVGKGYTNYGVNVPGIAGLIDQTTIYSAMAAGVGTTTPTLKTDFNGDGKSDLLWRNTDGSVAQWQMSGTTPTPVSVGKLTADWTIAGTGDFSGNKYADMLLTNTDGRVASWQLNGSSVTAAKQIGILAAGSSVAGTGDFTGDGTSDVLLKNTDGKVSMWQIDSSAITATKQLGTLGAGWSIAGTGDFNGDTIADLLLINTDGSIAEWQISAASVVTAKSVGKLSSGSSLAGIGDFNGDGKSDLIFRNANGSVAQWLMNGETVTNASTIGSATADWKIAGTGDFNGDKNADILWRNDSGAVGSWQMNGSIVTASGSLSNSVVATSWQIAAPML